MGAPHFAAPGIQCLTRGKMIAMRSAQVADLKEQLDDVLEAVKNGETVEIREGENAVAAVVPLASFRDFEPFPDDFFTRPLPKADASVLDQLLEDRRTGR
jgi:antitoxin (DNA-binding transcriptional repressor) of toxin-antitoxin stability system